MEKEKIKVGLGTAGSRLKSLWKSTGSDQKMSLKQFVREQKDNPDVREWRANKLGKNATKRTDARKAHIAAVSASAKQNKKAVKK